MTFDYGNVLTDTWRMAWKHKSIWGLLLLPMLITFLPFFLFFILIIVLTGGNSSSNPSDATSFIILISFLILFGLTTLVSFVVSSVANASATLGVIRAERGEGSTRFMDLVRDGLPYFKRILGVMSVVNLTIGLIFTLFFMLSFVLIIVTIGIAAICMQPIFLLLTPLMFLMIGVMEAAYMAVISEEMTVMDAVKRALQVVREHIWKYVVIGLIIYFGSAVLSGLIIFPLMLPMFAAPFLFGGSQASDTQGLIVIGISFICLFFPAMLLVSSFIGVLMKTSLGLTYLRLTGSERNLEKQVIVSEP